MSSQQERVAAILFGAVDDERFEAVMAALADADIGALAKALHRERWACASDREVCEVNADFHLAQAVSLIGTPALASQRSDGRGRSERATERRGPDPTVPAPHDDAAYHEVHAHKACPVFGCGYTPMMWEDWSAGHDPDPEWTAMKKQFPRLHSTRAPWLYSGQHDDCIATIAHYHAEPYQRGQWGPTGRTPQVEARVPESCPDCGHWVIYHHRHRQGCAGAPFCLCGWTYDEAAAAANSDGRRLWDDLPDL